MFVEMLRVAAQSIRANFFRAFLTMLGVIIGVAAVITMVAVPVFLITRLIFNLLLFDL